jgi:hypothetical protein
MDEHKALLERIDRVEQLVADQQAQIVRLKAELAAKDKEIAHLKKKSFRSAGNGISPRATPKGKPSDNNPAERDIRSVAAPTDESTEPNGARRRSRLPKPSFAPAKRSNIIPSTTALQIQSG